MTQHIEEAWKVLHGIMESEGAEEIRDLDSGLAIATGMAAALAAAEERGRVDERERIVERLWAAHAEEHAKLGVMLGEKREDEIETNWQGGKVNGLSTAIQITKEPTP